MAILEELTTRLGFEVEGLAKLKAAAKAFAGVKDDVIKSANPLKQAGASAGVTAVAIGRLGNESRKSSRGVLLLSTALSGLKRAGSVAMSVLRGVLMVALRLIPAFAGLVAGGGVLAGVLAAIGAKAALARREMALTAKTAGTTAGNLETVTNIFKGLGLGDEAEKSAQAAVEKMNELTKAIKKGGEEGEEAKKKLKGFGIDSSLAIGADGKMRDSSALLLDVIEAYKTAQEKAQALRKKQETTTNPRQKRKIGAQALEQERKADKLADDTGIEGKLKALLDELSMREIRERNEKTASRTPTTSPESERQQAEVAKQAVEAGLKVDAVLQGVATRFTELGVAIATEVLPPLNTFLDSVVGFAKRIGLISENAKEKRDRESYEAASKRAEGMRAERSTNDLDQTDTPQAARNRSQSEFFKRQMEEDRKRYGTPTEAPLPPKRADTSASPLGALPEWNPRPVALAAAPARMGPGAPTAPAMSMPAPTPGWLDGLKSLLQSVPKIKADLSPEMNASKMKNAAAQTKVDQNLTATATATATFNGIFDETAARKVQQMIDQSIQQAAGKLKAQGAGVLGAISAKGSNSGTASAASP
ncbi:hypothetical protein SAMN04515666_103609 [Bosea lupini]|uniref:Uncharacterized protein n=1 Tax=Bosea lupini TaxID=1036779 RepID=A0A1H7PTT9_9HYPH|nr:hypothetical protein [Bosea lupini]SEL39240.1 hypothetical protein SAMN04515666_103609 [Bosea lupini]